MTTALESKKLTLHWPDFVKQPINSFKLPQWNLGFRGAVLEKSDEGPENHVGYELDINSDDFFYRFLYSFQSKDYPFLYIPLGDCYWHILQENGVLLGDCDLAITLARVQNIPSVTNIKNYDELEKAVQFLFDKEDSGEMFGPDFTCFNVGDIRFLRENSCGQRRSPRFIFYLPVDHRHLLMFNFTFGGQIPIGELPPSPLFHGLMDCMKDFLSHVQLEKSDN